MKKINITTLGCSKNLVDSETIATYLHNQGYKVVFDGKINEGEIAIINTCGFIQDAKQESIDTIMQFVDAKNRNVIKKVYVLGCLSERYKEDLINEVPEIDGFFGVTELPRILETLKIDYKQELHGERYISTPSHYAYLKIAEGCNRSCAFCAIPLIRGKYESRTIEKIVEEAVYLAENGVKELLIISQDTSYYGKDLYNKFALVDLLTELVKIEKIEWIRIHYLYPMKEMNQLVDFISKNPKICRYFDIPFQHISDNILKSMKRGHTKQDVWDMVNSIREKIPQAALRTTMLVGFPGETKENFAELVDFIEKVKFDRLGTFTYSEEEGTFAATLKDNVSAKTKKDRMEKIMQLQSDISFEINSEKTGKVFKTIIERKEGAYYIGRSEFDSPEVDNEILIKTKEKLNIGSFYNVKIVEASEYDLYGEIFIL